MKERIKALCKMRGVSLASVEDSLGFARGYLSKLGNTTPNGPKLQKIADYFGVTVEYILTGVEARAPYYLNEDSRELAQFLYEHPEYKVLFDASRKVKPEDIAFISDMIGRASR